VPRRFAAWCAHAGQRDPDDAPAGRARAAARGGSRPRGAHRSRAPRSRRGARGVRTQTRGARAPARGRGPARAPRLRRAPRGAPGRRRCGARPAPLAARGDPRLSIGDVEIVPSRSAAAASRPAADWSAWALRRTCCASRAGSRSRPRA
jgi:hypothetical protein